MAIASPSASSFSASYRCAKAGSSCSRFVRLPPIRLQTYSSSLTTRRLTLSSRFNASSSSSSMSSNSNKLENECEDEDEDVEFELQHDVSTSPLRERVSPVYVKLPLDSFVFSTGKLRRKKNLYHSFRVLAALGVEGVVMEVWWGLVERFQPFVYYWSSYFEILALAETCGLKVRAVLAFHQGGRSTDRFWIPLPQWVLNQIKENNGLAYRDRFGRMSIEYISLGCDRQPVLCGRSPIEAYADFMMQFRDMFQQYLGGVITGIQVGMGPGGELRYPSPVAQDLTSVEGAEELGEFQCYDTYMQTSLKHCAKLAGMPEWGKGGPIIEDYVTTCDPERLQFFRSDGYWDTPRGKFFLEWYTGLLILHGERICSEAARIFSGTEVSISGKVASVHWHYNTVSHPSELTAGYYNTILRNGYSPIACMFARHGFIMCCSGFEMEDLEQQKVHRFSSPEGLLRQLILTARAYGVPLEGENSDCNWDKKSFQQMLNMSKFCSDGLHKPSSFSFNFNRLDKGLLENDTFFNFTSFVRQISNLNAS